MGKPGLGRPAWGSKHLRPQWRSRRRRKRSKPFNTFFRLNSDNLKKNLDDCIVDGSGRAYTCMLIQVFGCCTTDNFEILGFCFYTWCCGAYLSNWPLLFLFQVMHDEHFRTDKIIHAHIRIELLLS
jgi:hypothetical protein